MSSAIHIMKIVWRAREEHFVAVWFGITASAAILAAWAVRNAPTGCYDHSWNSGSKSSGNTARWHIPIVILLTMLFGVGYAAAILKWSYFTYYDNYMFTLQTLEGRDILPPIWAGQGRFFPLAHQEFNVIRHFTHTIQGYLSFSLLEVVILFCLLLALDPALSLAERFALAISVLCVPSVFMSFGELIFTERNVVLWIAVLAIAVRQFEKTHSAKWAILGVVAAQFIAYYKETAFLLLLGFAGARLLLRCRKQSVLSWIPSWLNGPEGRLDLSFVGVTVVFLLYYATILLHQPNMHYADESHSSLFETIRLYLGADPLPWLLLIVTCVKGYRIIRGKADPSLLWDSLAFGGSIYFVSYLALRMFKVYFLAPADMIAILYLGRTVVLSWRCLSRAARTVAAAGIVAILLVELTFSACWFFEDKNLMYGKAQIAEAIRRQHDADPARASRLFFPYASPWLVMELSAYLSHIGVPVEGSPAATHGGLRVTVAAASLAQDGPCVDYQSIVCHAATSPLPGDIVIVLSDDRASSVQASIYRRPEDLVCFYKPSPAPQWFSWLTRHFRVVRPYTESPDRWLDASVSIWTQPKI